MFRLVLICDFCQFPQATQGVSFVNHKRLEIGVWDLWPMLSAFSVEPWRCRRRQPRMGLPWSTLPAQFQLCSNGCALTSCLLQACHVHLWVECSCPMPECLPLQGPKLPECKMCKFECLRLDCDASVWGPGLRWAGCDHLQNNFAIKVLRRLWPWIKRKLQIF